MNKEEALYWINLCCLNNILLNKNTEEKILEARDIIIKILESENNQQKEGEWLPFEYDYTDYGDENVHILPKGSETHWEEYWAPEYVCSQCGYRHHMRKFCPNCGARMKGGE